MPEIPGYSAVPITLHSLGEIGGGAAALVVDQSLAMIARDLDERGSDGKPRKVVITITATQGKSGLVDVDVQASPTIPPFRTDVTATRLASRRDGRGMGMLFEPLSQDNPHQPPLPFEKVEGEVDG